MKNSFKIFFRDLKNIGTNWVALVILGGLVFLPSLYAWLNIGASWDPYGQTDQLPIGIVNEDVGEMIRDESVHAGDEIVDSLKDNDSMQWHFLDQDKAMDQLRKGDLFAVVVIPEDFSKSLGTVLQAHPEKANVEYYVNEKLNAIAPKITEKGASVIVEEVSSTFISTVNGVIFEVFNEIGLELEKELPDIERFEEYVFEIEERLPDIHETLTGTLSDAGSAQDLVEKAKKELPRVEDTVNQGMSTLNETSNFLQEAEDRLDEMGPKIRADLEKAQTSVADINAFIADIQDVNIDFSAGKEIKADILEKVDASIEHLESVEGALESVLARLKEDRDSGGDSGGSGEDGSGDGSDAETGGESGDGSNEDGEEGSDTEDGENAGNGEEAEDGEAATERVAQRDFSDRQDVYIEEIENTLEKIDLIKSVLEEGRTNTAKIDDFIEEKSGEVDNIFNNISEITENAGNRIDEFIAFYDETIEPTVLTEVAKAKNTLAEARSILTEVESALPEVERLLNNSGKTLDDGTDLLEEVLNEYPFVEDKVSELAEKIRKIQGEADIGDIIELLQNDPESERGFFAEPVTMTENKLFPIENYGSGMTPFYTVLSLWVGGLLLISLLSTTVVEPELFKPREVYFGKMFLFMLLGLLQTVIVTSGDVLLLNVKMANPIWFIVFGLFCSMIFIIIIYTLVSIFGDVGKAMAIVMLVLQIAGSGGTYPVALLPKFFQAISPFLPFTYAVDIMREAVGGIVWNNVIHDLIILSIFGIIAILFGTLLKEPINKQTDKLVEKSDESGVFH